MAEEGQAANFFKALMAAEFVRDAYLAYGVIADKKSEAGVKDPRVLLSKEIGRLQDDLHTGDGIAVNQQ